MVEIAKVVAALVESASIDQNIHDALVENHEAGLTRPGSRSLMRYQRQGSHKDVSFNLGGRRSGTPGDKKNMVLGLIESA